MESISLLDCTLRDGGYYVDWDFDEETVRKYLAAVGIAKIDIVEIGFRFFPQDKFLGAFAYSSDAYLDTLPLPDGVAIAVMVNAAELIGYPLGRKEAVHALFKAKSSSSVDIVRIATHAKDVTTCRDIAQELDKLGYRVFLNLMQVDVIEPDELTQFAQEIALWKSVETLYFADSFGSMESERVAATIKTLARGWNGPIGIHAHDNKGQALSNCIAALKCGINCIDSTLTGMGRGAGNAKTENLLVELSQNGYGNYFPDAVFPLVLQEFGQLQECYQWGPNIYYFLSAAYGIHPTYIQEMLGDERYDTEQILSAINFLKSTRAPFYSFENMLRAISGVEGDERGSWSATDWLKGNTVLILGAGPGTKRYIEALRQYVERYKPVVLCLNVNDAVPPDMVNAYVACHETRILIESDSYSDLDKPLIIPLSRVPESILDALHGVEIFDYGLRVEESAFYIAHNGCVLSNPLALSYAISVATAGGAGKILLAGVDGYELTDPRQQEMVDILEGYESIPESLPLLAITPTTYPVDQRSIYEPGL